MAACPSKVPGISTASRISDVEEFQSIPTSGARDWRFFSIKEEKFLAVANNFDGLSPDTDSRIYRWNGSLFEEFQKIPTNWATEWEAFSIEGEHYLAIADNHSFVLTEKRVLYDIPSRIYKWNGESFVEYQSIPTMGASGMKFFELGGEHFLAVANNGGSGGNYLVDSKIYRWNGKQFTLFQSIPTKAALRWEFFHIGTDSFLAVANYSTDFKTTFAIDSMIYRWDGKQFAEFQAIPTVGAHYWKYFQIGSDSFLAIANLHSGPKQTNLAIDSKIYRWDGKQFAPFQTIPTTGCVSWDFGTAGGDCFLAAASWKNDAGSFHLDSNIYRWDGKQFSLFRSIPTYGASDCAFFNLNSELCLAVANGGGGPEGPKTDSKLFRLSR
ncbi:MAG TPA: hypothetical protein DD435_08975 [Cyanobacteria bacterium UBA8530]|nr:hypothetical protein [Cyanobacteria bacterium UBA8530]